VLSPTCNRWHLAWELPNPHQLINHHKTSGFLVTKPTTAKASHSDSLDIRQVVISIAEHANYKLLFCINVGSRAIYQQVTTAFPVDGNILSPFTPQIVIFTQHKILK
jgi:hypothetical protein